MGCNCKGVAISSPKCDADKCLIVKSIRIGCNDGPAPCGDTGNINLSTFNDTTASPCDVEYSIENYDDFAFSSVTISNEGVLEFTTTSNYIKYKEFVIDYKVNSPCSILSATASVYVCVQNLCVNNDCDYECDKCTGDCIEQTPEISISSPSINEISIK